MKYRLTPLNSFCALLTGFEIVLFAFPEALNNQANGYQHTYLIPIILAGLLIDFILQTIIKKYYWLVIVELGILVTTILLNVKT